MSYSCPPLAGEMTRFLYFYMLPAGDPVGLSRNGFYSGKGKVLLFYSHDVVGFLASNVAASEHFDREINLTVDSRSSLSPIKLHTLVARFSYRGALQNGSLGVITTGRKCQAVSVAHLLH